MNKGKKANQPLDKGTITYCINIKEVIDSCPDGDADLNILLENVFKEISPQLVEISQDGEGSKMLESLINKCSSQWLAYVLLIFASDWSGVVTNSLSSRVIQAALQSLRIHLYCNLSNVKEAHTLLGYKVSRDLLENVAPKDEEEGKQSDSATLSNIIIGLSSHVRERASEYITHESASYVLRSLLELLSGVFVPPSPATQKYSLQSGKLKLKPRWTLKKLNAEFKTLSSAIMDSNRIKDFLFSPTGNPVIQTIIYVYHILDQSACDTYCQTIATHFMKKSKYACHHKVSSYLVEQILIVASDCLIPQLINSLFRKNLSKMALGNISNFLLQRVLDRINSKQQFKVIFDELKEVFEDIYKSANYGVFSHVAEACARLHCREFQMTSALVTLFNLASLEDIHNQLVPTILSMKKCQDDISKSIENDAWGDQIEHVTYHGSVLLQHLLRFTKNKLVVKSLVSLSPNSLKTLSCSKTGSYVMDVFFTSHSVTGSAREKVAIKMESVIIDMACNPFGSHVVEAAINSLGVESKAQLVLSLAQHRGRLSSDAFGNIIRKKFLIELFVQSKDEWEKRISRRNNFKRSFEEVIGGSKNKNAKRRKFT